MSDRVQKQDEPVVEITVPYTNLPKCKNGYIDWTDIPDDPPVIAEAYEGDTTVIPEILFLEQTRNLILSDPIIAAKKLGIPELARLDDLPRLDKPLTLKSILEFYIDQKDPSKDERRKCVTAWKGFCKRKLTDESKYADH